ncbi:MAG: N-acetyltransferase [Gemmatimonadota bacterium]|nr:N-acetyltransferase [Gemmatimonadota bacterium]
MTLEIRPERDADRAGVRSVNRAAFETPQEADIVDALRRDVTPIVSLVAVEGAQIVGHIMFSPVGLDPAADSTLMGLGPMAVLPARQRSGIGSALVGAGLERCRELGCDGVVVLGHPAYYPRFGFVPASRYGLRCEYDVPPEVFMAFESRPGSLGGVSGTVRYAAPFRTA